MKVQLKTTTKMNKTPKYYLKFSDKGTIVFTQWLRPVVQIPGGLGWASPPRKKKIRG